MIFLGLLQLIVYKLTLSLVKNPAFPFTPKPGQVTLDNLNEHARGEKNAPAPFPVQPPAEHLELRGGYIFGSLALIISLPLVFMFSHQSPGSPQQISVLQKQTNLEEGIRNDFQKLEKMQKAIIRKKEYLSRRLRQKLREMERAPRNKKTESARGVKRLILRGGIAYRFQ